jgi:hypothetical protein
MIANRSKSYETELNSKIPVYAMDKFYQKHFYQKNLNWLKDKDKKLDSMRKKHSNTDIAEMKSKPKINQNYHSSKKKPSDSKNVIYDCCR